MVENGQKTLACVLQDFPSVTLPLGVVLSELLRPVTVRYYSISSSSLESPKEVSITAVVVRYALGQSHLRLKGKTQVISKDGFATSCLERLHDYRVTESNSNDSEGKVPKLYLPVYIRSSNFRLPKDPSKPVVMVGPGTGVAPFRGFVRERVLVASKNVSVGPTWLFFGSRNEKHVSNFIFIYHVSV
jgi:NADPH-ferrihemoprotein reductase